MEDEENLRTVIRKRLTKEGYSVDACGDGQEALDYMAVSPYDTVILDIMMPKMSGMEVLKKMRAGGDQTPVLFLTAKDGIEDRVTRTGQRRGRLSGKTPLRSRNCWPGSG